MENKMAGRALDALVAEKVLEWKWVAWDIVTHEYYSNASYNPPEKRGRNATETRAVRKLVSAADAKDSLFRTAIGTEELYLPEFPDVAEVNLPYFSADIAAAWQVVEHFRVQGKLLIIETYLHEYTVRNYDDFMLHGWSEKNPFEIVAETAPLAICRAALAALRETA